MNNIYKKVAIIVGVVLSLIILVGVYKFNFTNDDIFVEQGGEYIPIDEVKGEGIETIVFDAETKEWKDQYGVCHTCTPENGFGSDGTLIEGTEACFAKRTASPIIGFDEDAYSYDFVRFIENDNYIKGKAEYYPYGTDSGVNIFEGEYFRNNRDYFVVGNISAEGDSYIYESIFSVNNDGSGIKVGHGETVVDDEGAYRIKDTNLDYLNYSSEIPAVTCEQYDSWYSEFLA